MAATPPQQPPGAHRPAGLTAHRKGKDNTEPKNPGPKCEPQTGEIPKEGRPECMSQRKLRFELDGTGPDGDSRRGYSNEST